MLVHRVRPRRLCRRGTVRHTRRRINPERDQASGDEPLGQVARLRNAVAAGAPVLWADVEIDETVPAVRLRREMEREMAPDKALAHGA